MRFKLYESVPKVNYKQFTDTFNRADDTTRDEIIKNFISQYNKPDLLNLLDAFRLSVTQKGFNPSTNRFLILVDNLSFKIATYNQKNNFYQLAQLAVGGKIDLEKDYLTRRDIYNVKPEEFNYVVNLFDIVNNPSKIAKFFKNTSNISEEQLYDENGNIKPVGREGDGTETLFGTVESWSGANGENDNLDSEDNNDESNKKSKTISQKELTAAKNKAYDTIQDVPSEECKDGNIIYVRHQLTGKKQHGRYKKHTINAFYMYSRGTWARIK